MRSGLLLGAIVLAIALTFWQPFRRIRSVLGVDHLVSTGHAFLALGYLLGLILGERTAPLSEDELSPVVAFAAGWVGFATGMRFDWQVLRTIPRRAFVLALWPAVAGAVVIGVACAGLLVFAQVASPEWCVAALVLAGAAATSGPTLVASVRARRAGRASHARPVLRLLEFAAGVDDLVVILIALVAFAIFRAEPAGLGVWPLLGAALGGGAALGAVTWLFLGGRAKEDERLLLGLAMLAFTAGFASWLYFSPVGIGAVAAITLVNLPGRRMDRLVATVRRVERPAVVILMIVIGVELTGRITWLFFPLLACMTLLRLVAKYVVGRLVAGSVDGEAGLRASPSWGLGLVPQGIFGMMVALSLFQVWQTDLSRTVLAAVAAASVLNELLGPWLLLRLLRGLSPARADEAPQGPVEGAR